MARDTSEFDYLSIEPAKYGDGVTVYGYGEYPKHSVNYGLPRKQFLDGFETVEEAQAAYPEAQEGAGIPHGWMPQTSPIPPADFDPMDAGEVWGEDDY